jgi:hypothetical protein
MQARPAETTLYPCKNVSANCLLHAPDREQMERFFFLVGYAITRWGHVDRALFDFCRFALGTTEEKAAVVFYASPNIGNHLVLADGLMSLSVNNRLLKRWKAIVKMADEHLPFRNELAHNPPVQAIHIIAGGNPKFPIPPPKSWWEITTEQTKLLLKRRQPRTSKEEDITNHIHAVNKLLKEMWTLRKMLPTRPRRFSAPKAPQASGSKTKNAHARGPRERRRRSSLS